MGLQITHVKSFLLALLFVLISFDLKLSASDWPFYRHDGNRSAVTQDSISGELNLQWIFESRHRPLSAWPMPGEETPRMHTDRAYHVVVSGRTLFFGNNIDNHVYALDTRTGEERWRFTADGAVRFAPILHNEKIYFGSDDGNVYCLNKSDGSINWKYRPSPSGERVIGNSRMISLWPVRTGLLLEEERIYLAAGIFPYEGIYVAAIDVQTGKEIWLNDTAGDQAWGHVYGGMAPQGYLVASKDNLFVPTGRGMPATFDKRTGKFNKFLNAGGKVGGDWIQMSGNELFAGNDNQGADTKITFDADSGANRGNQFSNFPSIDMVVTDSIAYLATQKGLYAIDRTANTKANTEVPKLKKEETKLVKQISDIRERHKAAAKSGNTDAFTKITAELNVATSRLTEITKEKEVLNLARAKWFLSREQIGPLAVAGQLGTMALTSNTLFAGGNGYALSIDAISGQLIKVFGINGTAMSLALADQRLFISTDQGEIYCLSTQPSPTRIIKRSEQSKSIPSNISDLDIVKQIKQHSGQSKGWCLVAGAKDGRLVKALAQETQMNIVVIEHDPSRLKSIRQELYTSTLYGNRVIAADWSYSELPDYFANLIVSERDLLRDDLELPVDHLARVLRPAGGVLLLGSIESWTENKINNVIEGLKANVKAEHKFDRSNNWLRFTKGKLKGAGSWTGLYGNKSKTSSTKDQLVKGPLGVLWFGEPGSKNMVDRHARSVSPLAINGRLFVQGMEVVMAYDAYNGTFLWERKIPGAIRVRVDVDSSNITVDEDSIFVATHDLVLQLDAQTGVTRREFRVPRSPGGKALRWGNISVDGNILFGTGAIPLENEYGFLWNTLVKNGEWIDESKAPEATLAKFKTIKASYPTPDNKAYEYFKRAGLHWYPINKFPDWLPDFKPSAVAKTIMLSEKVFAYDITTGDLVWEHSGKSIPNISLVIGGDRVFFLQDDVNENEKKKARSLTLESIQSGVYIPENEQKLPEKDRDIRRVVCLDAKTGKEIWNRPQDLTGSGGTKLGLAYQNDKLLFFGHYSNHDEGPFNKGELSWRRITVMQAGSGSLLWSKPLNYRRRPAIVGDTIYIEPRRCDLATGKIQKRTHPITGKSVDWEFVRPGHSCGIVTASPHNLFFRSYSGAIVNTEQDSGLQLFGGMRPGCWNSMIPANGVLSMQESSAGCTCNYSLRTTVVLKNKPQKGHAEWAVFISQAANKPVKHLAINFGAPGDMRAKDGTVWFSYPRPNTKEGRNAFANYGIKFNLNEEGKPEVVQRDWIGKTFTGTNKPWLYTSGLKGLTKIKVPLLEKKQKGVYSVHLGFSKLPEDTIGSRIFDIKIQGKTVVKSVDIAKAAGGFEKVILHKFNDVDVVENLEIELIPANIDNTKLASTIIQTLEVTRKDFRAAN